MEFYKRLGLENINAINERIVALKTKIESGNNVTDLPSETDIKDDPSQTTHKGRVIFDATACLQDIAYPTDLDLLNQT